MVGFSVANHQSQIRMAYFQHLWITSLAPHQILEKLGQGEVFGSVEAVKTVSDLNMPVEGEVLEINEAINDQPELVNNDPYGEGWMIKISVVNPDDLNNLLDAAGYQTLIS